MKTKLSKILRFVKEHKKKTLIIMSTLVLIIAVVITAVVMLIVNKKDCSDKSSSGNIASNGAISKETLIEEQSLGQTTETTSNNETIEQTTEEPGVDDNQNIDTDGKPSQAGDSSASTMQNNGTVMATGGALHVDGTRLVDAAGNPVQLKGISTHGLAWFPEYVNEECFRQLHENFNVNVIRLAMYTAEYNGYCNGGDRNYLKGLIEQGVQYATNNGMYVIIDWHILSDGNPNSHKDEAKEFFAEMAQKYSSNNNVFYEICNEPNGGTSWNEIKSYANEVIGVIRQYDRDGIIIVGTPNWSQFVDQAAADPITGYSNIMYALHFYAATHKEDLRGKMINAINEGLPIFVTEYGICDASGNGGIDEGQSGEWISTMNAYGVSYVMWNLSNKDETSSIISSGCSKASGFTEGDLSGSGKWFLQMMTGGLSLPEVNVSSNQNSNDSQNQNQNQNQQGQHNDGDSSNSVSNTQGAADVMVVNSINIVNSWQSNNGKGYQYEVTVTNNSGVQSSSWQTDIAFNENMEFVQGWNGNFSMNGNVLHITSADFNGTLANGASAGNIGFIVNGK